MTMVGERLRFLREKAGLTQEQLAELAGIATARISELESGRGNTTLKTIEKITTALNILPVELFDFGQIRNNTDLADKQALVDMHTYALMDRNLEEVNYIVDFTNQLLNLLDKK